MRILIVEDNSDLAANIYDYLDEKGHILDAASLGNLYYQVPGWPIGFGNDKKARDYLEKALQINPNGIEPNYFYGEFLYQEGEYEKALQVLNKAMNAPARLGRELSDAGQRKEIAAKIEDVKRQL